MRDLEKVVLKEIAKDKLDKLLNELKEIQLECNEEIDSYNTILEGLEVVGRYSQDTKKLIKEYRDRQFDFSERVCILDEVIRILENIKEI